MEYFDIIHYIGMLTLVTLSYQIGYFFWFLVKLYVLPRYGFCKNLRDYGEWAVVTGATDGIGKEYAKQLADCGLNVFLISRTEEKLRKVAEEIKTRAKVKVEVLAYDFTNVNNYEIISDKLKGLDIGILVNNVGQGYATLKTFDESDVEKIVSVMNVNMVSDVRMTHIALPGMLQRGRGAVIHISSGSIYLSATYINVYIATKLFMKKLTDTLQLESKGKVDHQLLTPMYVESNLSKMKPGLTVPSAEDYVSSALKTIGISNNACGYLSHELLSCVMKLIPASITTYFYQVSRERRLRNVKVD